MKPPRAPLPIDTFPLLRCRQCGSTRLRFSKTKLLARPNGEIEAKKTYLRCEACGRKSRAIFD